MTDQNQQPPDAEPVPQITLEQGAKIAAALYEPTIRRMNILCNALITTTSNGDFALWAPMTVMQQQLLELRWSDAPGAERFLALISLALRRYAEKCEVFRLSYVAAVKAGAPPPPFPTWQDPDTIVVYGEIDALYPIAPPAEAPAVAPDGPPADPRGTGE